MLLGNQGIDLGVQLILIVASQWLAETRSEARQNMAAPKVRRDSGKGLASFVRHGQGRLPMV